MTTDALEINNWVRFIEPDYSETIQGAYETTLVGRIGKVIKTNPVKDRDFSATNARMEYRISFINANGHEDGWYFDWQLEQVTKEEATLWKLSN